MKEHITIYTDGSCLGNPGRGGYGFILRYKEHYKEGYGGFLLTTNNRMELIGVIRALTMIRSRIDIILYTDSKYIRNAIEEGWLQKWQRSGWKTSTKKSVKNRDLWEHLYSLLTTYTVRFEWVKAHNGNTYNERCDILAKQGAQMENQERDIVFEESIHNKT
ncbi:MAG: ribonuclease HI [Desulfovibrionaceae bacterium]|nr:ribonuclease HI [Desulfovibrionaceae bacterium]